MDTVQSCDSYINIPSSQTYKLTVAIFTRLNNIAVPDLKPSFMTSVFHLIWVGGGSTNDDAFHYAFSSSSFYHFFDQNIFLSALSFTPVINLLLQTSQF
jgi:hypothetical protein